MGLVNKIVAINKGAIIIFIMRKTVFLFFMVLAAFIGCGEQSKNKIKIINIVEINGKVYTSVDLWHFANNVLWEMEPKDLDNDQVKDKILQDFIVHTLLVQEAERLNVSADRDALNQLTLQLSTEQGAKELKAITGKFEMDPDETSKIAKERLLIDTMIRDKVDGSSYISEEELRNFYNSKNIPKNPLGEAHVLHIFSTDNDTINMVARELNRGIQFSELARQYSEGPERRNGGDLGFIQKSSYPEFFSAAFNLKEGETSDIIQSEYGYHIFRMVQHARAGKNSYESLKPALLAELYAEKYQELVGEFINEIYSNATIKMLNNFNLSDIIPNSGRR